jgi:pyruvate dehydrogenase E2 component (dihydrolipoyllysine-residue acetyltransferase)
MSDIVMPRLSDTMEEGTILRWLKHDGEQVGRGEELVEIETDKATMSYPSDRSGVLRTVAAEGDTLAVGALIAHVGDEGEHATPQDEAPVSRPADAPAPDGARAPSQPTARAGKAVADAGAGRRVRASPLARRLARESNVDLGALAGSGPGGRVVKADVLAAARVGSERGGGARVDGERGGGARADSERAGGGRADSERAGRAGLADVATAKGQTTVVELSRTQQAIARRMAESKATIPHFTLQSEIDMEACVTLRGQLKRLAAPAQAGEQAGEGTGGSEQAPTYNDMVVKACALALREHPRANSSYRDGRLALHSRVNVGVAVAVEQARPGDRPPGERQPDGGDALVVATVFDADEKSLGEIARETRALAARVREGTVTPPELGGGTFTVSNLGMHGVSAFSAIINPPQVAILAVGEVAQRAVVRDGQLAARHLMTATLACDHRVLYGADAARLLTRVRELLQQPAALTL